MVGYLGVSDTHPLGRLLLERISMRDIGYELPRTPLPGTWVNKLPVNAPNPSGWHHAHDVDPVEERRLA